MDAKLKNTLNLLGKRVVPFYFGMHNPPLFYKWGYNACRQTAVIIARYLMDKLPYQRISVYEGYFDDPVFGKYDHAFVYVEPNFKAKLNGYIIDTSTVTFDATIEQKNLLPTTFNLHGEGTMVRKEKVDWMELLEESEYYTGKPYKVIIEEVLKLIEK